MGNYVYENINKIPVRTWSWLGVNDISVSSQIPETSLYPSGVNESFHQLENIQPMDETKNNLQILNCLESEGISPELTEQAKNQFNTGFYLETLPNQKIQTPITIPYRTNQLQNSIIDNNVIIAKENSEVTVMIDYKSKDDLDNRAASRETLDMKDLNEVFHNGLTRIYLEKGATVNLIKIQSLLDTGNHFDTCIASLEENAKINYILIELGSQTSITNIKTDLMGTGSMAEIHTVYIGDKDRKIDINYLVNHYGKETKSKIEVKSALLDKSSKIFKGTLDFKKGAKKSVGQEEEYAVLLSKEVRNRSVPILLCSEDDVSGQHAASAGKIDENKLFYLMTRGFSEADAKKLIIEAAIGPIIDLIPLEEIRTSIYDGIRRRLAHEL